MALPLWFEALILLVSFFIVVPSIAVVIGRAAWLNKPKNWDRSMYWTAFIVSTAAAVFLLVYSQRIQVDARTWRDVIQVAVFFLGVALFGVAAGCAVGIFTYGRGRGPIWRGAKPRRDHSAGAVETDHSDKQ